MIADTLRDLIAQDLLLTNDVRIVVLLNGCTDATPTVVSEIASLYPLIDPVFLTKAGKSRAWNSFVHHESRNDCDVLFFVDADIRIPQPSALSDLVAALKADENLFAVNSRPIKDLAHLNRPLTVVEKLILASAETTHDWRQAICGQLYAMPARRARAISLPIGLPVEDGFLHAMIATGSFNESPVGFRVGGSTASHIYESERSIASLVRHQTRIVIGSSINSVIFQTLANAGQSERRQLLLQASQDEEWLPNLLTRSLPRFPYGFVPVHFLVKRSQRAISCPRELLRPRRLIVIVAGAAFDLLVYIIAQLRMARGIGAGYW